MRHFSIFVIKRHKTLYDAVARHKACYSAQGALVQGMQCHLREVLVEATVLQSVCLGGFLCNQCGVLVFFYYLSCKDIQEEQTSSNSILRGDDNL